MATCPCGSPGEHQAYMRGRRETRERLGYSGFDDGGGHPDPYRSVPTSAGGPGPDWLEVPALGMPARRIPASPADDELLRIREECQCGAHQAMRLQRAMRGCWDDPSNLDLLAKVYDKAEKAGNKPVMESAWALMKRIVDSEQIAAFALAPDAVCKGCRIPESSPIGAGPFENGLCRFCAGLNTFEPIAAAPRHQDLASLFAEPQLRSLREVFAVATVILACIVIMYFMMVT